VRGGDEGSGEDAGPELARVVLLGLPVALHERAVAHATTLRRELALVRHAGDAPSGAAHAPTSVPDRLLALSQELGVNYVGYGSSEDPVMQQAVASGAARADLVYDVPRSAGEAAQRLHELLDEVDGYCRSGELVSLVTPPDVHAYRSWYLSEFTRQLRDGAPPEPWTSVESPSGGTPRPPVTHVVVVDDDLDLEGAAHVRGELAEALERGATELRIDMSRCDFIDSVGISLLLTTLLRLEDAGGRLIVVEPTERVRTTLRHAGIAALVGLT